MQYKKDVPQVELIGRIKWQHKHKTNSMKFSLIAINAIISFCLIGCKRATENKQNSNELTSKNNTVLKKEMQSFVKEYSYSSKGNFASVIISTDNLAKDEIKFKVRIKGNVLEGNAKLVLIEDNGVYSIPEGTPILDEITNEEYSCDSTYSYESKNISLTFAMEQKTKERLSFIVYNSKIKGVNDSLFTLYNY